MVTRMVVPHFDTTEQEAHAVSTAHITTYAKCLKKLPQKMRFPRGLTETHEHEVIADDQGAFYQHAVGGEQRERLLVAHAGIELGLDAHLAIEDPARVEEAADGEAARLLPSGELIGGGVVLHDMAVGVGHAMLIEPLLRLLAGSALGIFDEQNSGCSVLILLRRAAADQRAGARCGGRALAPAA